MTLWDQRVRRPAPPPAKKDTGTDAVSALLGAILLWLGVAFTDAWLFMLLIDGLNAAWFPHLATLGYWQAFGIVVPVQWLIRRVKVKSK